MCPIVMEYKVSYSRSLAVCMELRVGAVNFSSSPCLSPNLFLFTNYSSAVDVNFCVSETMVLCFCYYGPVWLLHCRRIG